MIFLDTNTFYYASDKATHDIKIEIQKAESNINLLKRTKNKA